MYKYEVLKISSVYEMSDAVEQLEKDLMLNKGLEKDLCLRTDDNGDLINVGDVLVTTEYQGYSQIKIYREGDCLINVSSDVISGDLSKNLFKMLGNSLICYFVSEIEIMDNNGALLIYCI